MVSMRCPLTPRLLAGGPERVVPPQPAAPPATLGCMEGDAEKQQLFTVGMLLVLAVLVVALGLLIAIQPPKWG